MRRIRELLSKFTYWLSERMFDLGYWLEPEPEPIYPNDKLAQFRQEVTREFVRDQMFMPRVQPDIVEDQRWVDWAREVVRQADASRKVN